MKLTGTLGVVRTLLNMRMFICLNPQLGVLVLYKKEENCPTKPHRMYDLSNMVKVLIKKDHIGDRGQMIFFELILNNAKRRFYAENADTVKSWVDSIRRAKLYHDWIQQVKELRYSDQIGNEERNKLEEYLNQSLKKPMKESCLPFSKQERGRR